MWQDCHDHDARPITSKDIPRYGDTPRHAFKTGTNARMLYRHPNIKHHDDPHEVSVKLYYKMNKLIIFFH